MGDAVAVPGPESHERARRGTIAIDDDELSADTFASAGSLHAFIAARVD